MVIEARSKCYFLGIHILIAMFNAGDRSGSPATTLATRGSVESRELQIAGISERNAPVVL